MFGVTESVDSCSPIDDALSPRPRARRELSYARDRDTLGAVSQSTQSNTADSASLNGARGAVACLCLIRWSLRPSLAEVAAAVETVVETRRALGRPPALVVVVDPEMEVPSPAVALELIRTVPIIERSIAGGVAIVPGNSLHVRALRGTVSAIGSVFHIGWDLCVDQDEAMGRLCRRYDLDFEAVCAEALARGLLLTAAQIERG